ncbi:DUF222 domain-containing protein [Aeromicrobium sp. CF4.19]|uniref:HNH endonuclease n=1 Tax=Aeromicrobium sp. CF4.19 TaxID=3373082 RepID=UPI003EE54058
MHTLSAQQTLLAALPGVEVFDDREALLAIQTAENALAAMKAERLAAVEETRSYELDGASSLTAWARARLRLAPGENKQLVAAARTGHDLPGVGEALRAGRIGTAHTALFSYGLKHLGHDVMSEASPWLLDVAQASEPKDLRQVIRSLRAAVYPDSLDEAWIRGMDKQDIQLNAVPDGFHLTGFLNAVTGAKFHAILSSLGAPRDADDLRTGAQRRIDGLDELLTTALEHGLPSDKGVRPQLMVLAPLDAAQEAQRAATEQDIPTRIGPPAELVGFGAIGPKLLGYLACGSDVTGVLTRDDAPVADVLNVGRTQRLATLKQRRVVITRQNGVCAAPGCSNTHLDIHHAVWWSRGGRTDIDQLVGLCPRCHTLVHRELLIVRALGRGRFDFGRSDGRPLASQPPPARTAHRELGTIRRIARQLQHQRNHHQVPMRI